MNPNERGLPNFNLPASAFANQWPKLNVDPTQSSLMSLQWPVATPVANSLSTLNVASSTPNQAHLTNLQAPATIPSANNVPDFRRSEVLAKFLISGFMSDCTFVVGPDNETAEHVAGHKLLFALASPVFEEMFNKGFKEAQANSEVRIKDAEPRHFKNFRYIIYNNDASVLKTLTVEDIIQIFTLSDKYIATAIAKYCIEYLTTSMPEMSVEDTTLMFQFALKQRDKILLQTVKNKILRCGTHVNKRLTDLKKNEFYEYILVLRQLKKPLETFLVIETYFANKLPNNLELNLGEKPMIENDVNENNVESSEDNAESSTEDTFLTKCLKCIDFANVNIKDFKKGPGESKILTFEQKYFIISRLGDAKSIIIN